MTYAWQIEVRHHRDDSGAALPPAMVSESAWDILLALHCDHNGGLNVEKVGGMASVSLEILNQWLATLEASELIIALADRVTREVRVMLTSRGRALLNGYLLATCDLQFGTHH